MIVYYARIQLYIKHPPSTVPPTASLASGQQRREAVDVSTNNSTLEQWRRDLGTGRPKGGSEGVKNCYGKKATSLTRPL